MIFYIKNSTFLIALTFVHIATGSDSPNNLRGSAMKEKGTIIGSGGGAIFYPTGMPTFEPTSLPTNEPTNFPSFTPSTIQPSFEPTAEPSNVPSSVSTEEPTTLFPTTIPTTSTFPPTTTPSSSPSAASLCIPMKWDLQTKQGQGLKSVDIIPTITTNTTPSTASDENNNNKKFLTVGAYTGNDLVGDNPDSTLVYIPLILTSKWFLKINNNGGNGYLQFDVSQIIIPGNNSNNKDILFHFNCPVGGTVSLYETDNYGGSLPSTTTPQYRGKVAVPGFWNFWGWSSSKTQLVYKIMGDPKYVKVKATNKCYIEYVNQICISG